jgi:hypothetical protein
MSAGAAAIDQASYTSQVLQTRQSLNIVDDATLVGLTRLGLGEVQALKQEVAEIFPASNLPAFLLQGLIQLEDRSLKPERIAADLKVLFRSTKQIGLFGTFLAAPALVLHGYQRLLALAGKDVASAFPDGPWQFYTEFGLREDAARHSVETEGFQRAAPSISDADAATCWVYAALCTLFGYDDLLANEWAERVLPRTLDTLLAERAAAQLGSSLPRKAEARERAIADHADMLRRTYQVDRLASGWAAQRPYSGPPGASLDGYIAHRQARFREYLDQALRQLPPDLRADLDMRYTQRRSDELPTYQRQMSVLMMLDAESYQDRRIPLPLFDAHVALVAHGRYYLLDACARDEQGHLLVFSIGSASERDAVALDLTVATDGALRDRYNRPVAIDRRGRVRLNSHVIGQLRPPPLAAVKGQVDAILRQAGAAPTAHSATDLLLASAPRSRQHALRDMLDREARAELAALRSAPIVVNWDIHRGDQPLAAIRRTRRGCGDHALTLVRTDRGMVFDMSHIFFDGGWGLALAEIITNCATSLVPLAVDAQPAAVAPAAPLALAAPPAFAAAAQAALAYSPAEVAAETTAVNLRAMAQLRRRLAKIQLAPTINDLLLLARCAHATSYQPGLIARRALEAIAALEGGPALVQHIMAHLDEQRTINPALLIPMDASAADPRLRLFPATFRNPLPELLPRLDRCNALVQRLRQQPDAATRQQFDQERRALYTDLRAFGTTLQALKQVTMRGESFTTAALRLLGHLPEPMQYLLDLIPQKIGILNEIIKGREVFSNVGQVAATSSLTRFASARDDGETKLLVWGIMSDAQGRLVITLRDFRPHVAPLLRLGRTDLAHRLAQDYLDDYAACANALVRRIQRVLAYQ